MTELDNTPLVVDLDGTLIHTDMLHESAMGAVKSKPLSLLLFPTWLSTGKAHLKAKLAKNTTFTASSLPFNMELLEWLKLQRAHGRPLILCTASDQHLADQIAQHLQIFSYVIASNGVRNMAGEEKAKTLTNKFGDKGFDYIGNSTTDIAVWLRARKAIVVNGNTKLISAVKKIADVEKVIEARKTPPFIWLKALRIHQWLKNILLFVPLIAAHEWSNLDSLFSLIIAFFAFSLCSSAVYIANDLLDLESDRQHSRKRSRPFAAGLLPIWQGVLLIPLLLITSAALAAAVGTAFLTWLSVYFLLTTAYSLRLKQVVLLDTLVLAMLYTLRIVAGAAAAGMSLSFWLLAVAVFLFLSLAFIKRYAELVAQTEDTTSVIHGRGYLRSDAPLIQQLGIAAGYASAVVLSLYLNSEAVLVLYQRPEWVWGAVPVLIFWTSWMWLQAHRGKMHDDPLVFAVTDKVSIIAGLFILMVIAAGTAS